MAVCQNLVPLVNIKIAGKWMFIPIKTVLIGIDPYAYIYTEYVVTIRKWIYRVKDLDQPWWSTESRSSCGISTGRVCDKNHSSQRPSHGWFHGSNPAGYEMI